MNLAGIDVGTSGVKCCVYNEEGKILTYARRNYFYEGTDEGYCLDGTLVWMKTKEVLKQVAAVCGGKISGVAVSAIGEACVLMDAQSKILAPSILYNDRRGKEESFLLRKKFSSKKIFENCGVSPNGTYSLEKLMWIRRHEPYFVQADRIFLYEDFITFCLTGERVISYSLASRTMGFHLRTKTWEKDLFTFAGIPYEKMSVPKPSGYPIGTIRKKLAEELGIREKTVVFAGGHDHSCCTLGAGMVNETVSVNISGSGDTVSYLLKQPFVNDSLFQEGFCNAPYTVQDYFTVYGLCAMSGTMLRWFRNAIYRGDSDRFYEETEKAVSHCETKLIVFPGFSAVGTPDFCSGTTGTMDGFTLKTTPVEIYKAMLESISFHMKMNRNILCHEVHLAGNVPLRTVGGGSNSDAWNQMKADILDCEVQTVENKEAGTVGGAMLAGMGLGLYHSAAEAAEIFIRISKSYQPRRERQKEYEEKYGRFLELYQVKRRNRFQNIIS